LGEVVIIDPPCRTATLTPNSPLADGRTYKALVVGGKSGVKGEDGSKLGGVNDPSATFKKGKVFWIFTTEAS
jgi:hypothetical protein